MQPLAIQPDLVDRVYRSILDAICDGALPAGTRLTQEQLAARLNVSRQPIVQALLLLRRQGFLAEAGRRGLMVASLQPEQVLHLYDIRAALDGLAAQGAAGGAKGDANRAGAAVIAAGRRAVKHRDVTALIAADIEFHQLLYSLSGNPLIADALALHWQHIRRVMGMVVRKAARLAEIWDEHEAILEAVDAGDGATAERLAREHAQRAARGVASALSDSALGDSALSASSTDHDAERMRRV